MQRPILIRAEEALERIVQSGTLYVRVHVDVDPHIGLKHLESILYLKERFKDRIHMEIVAFPQQGLLNHESILLMKEALRNGAELVGGVDPAGVDRDMDRSLDVLFDLSGEFDSHIDLHLHDPYQIGKKTILKMIELTKASDRSGKVAISHAYCLGQLDREELEEVAEGLVAQRISIISSVPIDTPLPPIPHLRNLGVKVHLGTDHPTMDAWTPFGCNDMLEKARRLAEMHMWFDDDSMIDAYTFIGIHPDKIHEGSPANFSLVQALNPPHALATLPPREVVFYNGRPVAGRMMS
ncbi:MAG: amidohydrolase family protein [Bacillota bacterium]